MTRIQHSEMFLYASSRASAMSFLLVRLSVLLFSVATSANRMMITGTERMIVGRRQREMREEADKIVTVKRFVSKHVL